MAVEERYRRGRGRREEKKKGKKWNDQRFNGVRRAES